MRQKTIRYTKAISVGLAILDLSKLHMAQFYYEAVKPVFGDRVSVM